MTPGVSVARVLLWGLFLARTALRTARVHWAMVLGGAALAASAHVVSAYAIDWRPQRSQWLRVSPLPSMPLFTFAGAGVATCAIGLCLALGQRWGHSATVRLFSPAGRVNSQCTKVTAETRMIRIKIQFRKETKCFPQVFLSQASQVVRSAKVAMSPAKIF